MTTGARFLAYTYKRLMQSSVIPPSPPDSSPSEPPDFSGGFLFSGPLRIEAKDSDVWIFIASID